MAKLSYAKLKLKTVNETKKIEIGDLVVEVSEYLSAETKAEMVSEVIMDSIVAGVVRVDLLDPLVHLHIVDKYTNITFTDKQKEDPLKLYDELHTNGLLSEILKLIPKVEYETITAYVTKYGEKLESNINASITGFSKTRKEMMEADEAAKGLVELLDSTTQTK